MNPKDPESREWEAGLPAPEDLMPLTQTLIPPDLALAFKIAIDQPWKGLQSCSSPDKMIATQCVQEQAFPSTYQNVQNHFFTMQHNLHIPIALKTTGVLPIDILDCGLSSNALKLEASLRAPGAADELQKRAFLGYGNTHSASSFMSIGTRLENSMLLGADSSEGGSRMRKRLDSDFEDVDSSAGMQNSNEESGMARTLKRPRLVWTPQLHKRFVEAVAQLGVKNAVPKTIMQLMNVDGLTRENVASHLQKYRVYLKRMKVLSSDGPGMPDHLFASSSLPFNLSGSSQFLSKHREDLVPFLMPVPMNNLGAAHMAESPPSKHSNMEHDSYNGLINPFPCHQRMSQVYGFDGRTRPGSPQRQVLKLFPQNGR